MHKPVRNIKNIHGKTEKKVSSIRKRTVNYSDSVQNDAGDNEHKWQWYSQAARKHEKSAIILKGEPNTKGFNP